MDVDVIVVGSGAAGLAAAHAAAVASASVLVAECEGRTGGSSRLSGCWIQAAGTSVQRAAGWHDSPEAMLQDYLAINRWRVEPGLARIYCEHAPDVVEWLVELGLPFGPIVRAGAERVPRGTARSARARRSSTCWSGRVVRAASSSRSGIGSTICS